MSAGCRVSSALRGASGKKWRGWTDQRWTKIRGARACQGPPPDRFDEPDGRLCFVSYHAKDGEQTSLRRKGRGGLYWTGFGPHSFILGG